MQEATFDLQTVTPLFLAGADQTQAEFLRAPSLRGALRYWLRAQVGALYGTDNEGLRNVVKVEKNVFGATDVGSAVQVYVSLSDKAPKPQQYNSESLSRGNATGKDYLFWSMAMAQKGLQEERQKGLQEERQKGLQERENKATRQYFPAGSAFRVTLSARYGEEQAKEQAFERALAAFWLMTHLGGLGSRSRRGAGSLLVSSSAPPLLPLSGDAASLPFAIPSDPVALQSQLEEGISVVRKLYRDGSEKMPLVHRIAPTFDVLSANYCRIWVLCADREQPWGRADDALRAIGKSLRDYRTSLCLHQRKIFGLPLKGVKVEGVKDDRMSSPLLLRVSKLQGENYVGVAVLFKTHIPSINAADYALIEKWIHDDFMGALEVKL